MKCGIWFLCAVVMLCALGRYFIPEPSRSPQPAASFDTLLQASASIQAQGYHCTSDRDDGLIGNGFLVSRDVVTSREVRSLSRAGQAWKGKVWLTHISTKDWQLSTTSDNGETRKWGNILAFGDNELLDEIEGALKKG